MAKVKYVGGVDEVSVLFPSGDMRTVKRGDTVDLLASDVAHLSPVDWEGKGVGDAFTTPAAAAVDVPASEGDPQ